MSSWDEGSRWLARDRCVLVKERGNCERVDVWSPLEVPRCFPRGQNKSKTQRRLNPEDNENCQEHIELLRRAKNKCGATRRSTTDCHRERRAQKRYDKSTKCCPRFRGQTPKRCSKPLKDAGASTTRRFGTHSRLSHLKLNRGLDVLEGPAPIGPRTGDGTLNVTAREHGHRAFSVLSASVMVTKLHPVVSLRI